MFPIRFIADITRPFRTWFSIKQEDHRRRVDAKKFGKLLKQTLGQKRMIYLGICQHQNLGDLAQYYCIQRWIRTWAKDYIQIQLDAPALVTIESKALEHLVEYYRDGDVIIFQSGYTTQDLGGVHDLMHRMVADRLQQAKMLMMPQTIFFQHEENKQKTAKALNACPNMLFLARDFTSYDMAKEMFPDIKVMAYPDIVTSLIGSLKFNNKRESIFLCRRNDGEKFYSKDDLMNLKDRLATLAPVEVGDTQSPATMKKILNNLQQYIEKEIERYSHYKVIVTDRYHGTIFSLAAGTPVIIIKTTDHKVTTGADWFKGVYDGYVTVAEDLDDAYRLAEAIVKNKKEYPVLPPYFEEKYYGMNLRKLINID